MQVRYRYVPYGTSFEPRPGARSVRDDAPAALYKNEIAADVGGVFWKRPGADDVEQLAVIDHHFAHEGQFPSASAAVLHSAAKVHQWWGEHGKQFDEVWLVTHEHPDFDAFASLHLIRSLQDWQGLDADALGMAHGCWRDLTPGEHPPRGRQRINWFDPIDAILETEVRWRLALAAAASLTDSCRRFGCHKSHSPPAVLYAALKRGRPFEMDGAGLFFRHFRDAVVRHHLNPVIDAIFESNEEFAPEVALLARELPAYERDVMRARRAIVAVPAYSGSFEEFFAIRKASPLVGRDLQPVRLHVSTDGSPSAADGIYIRDPESLLFKDLARMDFENSSLGQGFHFTAVAYSNGRPDSPDNRTDYYFALDPERADKSTLYPLWVQLQCLELQSMTPENSAVSAALEPRAEFRDRAAQLGGLFNDPWFDGANYKTTLVATPHRGTAIGPAGKAPDLSDDPVAAIVSQILEDGVYATEAHMLDFSRDGNRVETRFKITGAAGAIPALREFRLCLVPLSAGLDLLPSLQGQQIGRKLWDFLHSLGVETPPDFLDSHLTRDNELIAVWSRRGVAIAYLPEASPRVLDITEEFTKLVSLMVDVRALTTEPGRRALDRSEDLLYKISVQRQELSMPHHLIAFRRFVDAIGVHDSLATVRDLLAARENQNIAEATRASVVAVREGQERVELLEILFVTLYSIELINILLERMAKLPQGISELRLLCLLGMFVAAVVWWGLSPKGSHRRGWSPIAVIPALTIILLIVAVWATYQPFLGWYQSQLGEEQTATHSQTQSQMPAKPAADTGPKPNAK